MLDSLDLDGAVRRGMGARARFLQRHLQAYGYEKEAVEIQDCIWMAEAGSCGQGAGRVLKMSHLVGPKSFVKERLAAYKQAGVTVLQVNPVGHDAVKQVETLRGLIDDL